MPVYLAATRVLGIRDAAGLAVAPADLPGATCVAVAGLARPGGVLLDPRGSRDRARGLLAFRDHDAYGPRALGRIERAAEETGATAVVTTEKDAVKLEGRLALPVYAVAVDMPVLDPGFVAEALVRLGRRPS